MINMTTVYNGQRYQSLATMTLSVDKNFLALNEIATFTVQYEPIKTVQLWYMKTPVNWLAKAGEFVTDNSGIGRLQWKVTEVGTFSFHACHTIIPGISIPGVPGGCGLLFDESNYIDIGVTTVPPKKYKCIPKIGCAQAPDGTFDTMDACRIGPPACVIEEENGGAEEKCPRNQVNIFGSCYKTSDIAIVAGVGVLLMVMMRQ